MSEPATKKDLDQAMKTLRSELSEMKDQVRGELRSDIAELRTGFHVCLGTMEGTLRVDLKTAVSKMEERIRANLDKDMKAMEERLRVDMSAMEKRLFEKFKEAGTRIANTVAESHRKEVAAVDEKYQDLPKQHGELRADFDGHVADLRLHPQPPTISAKRLRRPRSR